MDYAAILAWALPAATPIQVVSIVCMVAGLKILSNMQKSIVSARKSIDQLNISVALLIQDRDHGKDEMAEVKRRLEKIEDSE
jgi:hypothetical protein